MTPLLLLLGLGAAAYAVTRKSAAAPPPALILPPSPTPTPPSSPSTPSSPTSTASTTYTELLRGTTSGKTWRLTTIHSPTGTTGDVTAPSGQWPGVSSDLFVLRFHLVGNRRVLSLHNSSAPANIVSTAVADFNVKSA